MPLQRIVLTGFMGSGKTTVGQVLAARLQWHFADLDHAVESRTGRTVPEIFAEQGEAAFRLAEMQALAELLQRTDQVIALGGGAPGTPTVRDLLQAAPRTEVVHLHAPFSLLYERCRLQALDPLATARPLLEQREAAQARYTLRLPWYEAVAQQAVSVEAATPEAIAEAILRTLALGDSV